MAKLWNCKEIDLSGSVVDITQNTPWRKKKKEIDCGSSKSYCEESFEKRTLKNLILLKIQLQSPVSKMMEKLL